MSGRLASAGFPLPGAGEAEALALSRLRPGVLPRRARGALRRLHSHVWEGVAKTPEGLTGAVLRVGSRKPKVIVRLHRALFDLGALSAFHGGHSERRPRFS